MDALAQSLKDCERDLALAREKYGEIAGKGGGEKEKAEKEEGFGDDGEGEGTSMAEGAAHTPVRCDICEVECPNQRAYEQHCAGKLHRSKELKLLRSSVSEAEGHAARGRTHLGDLDPAFRDLVLGSHGDREHFSHRRVTQDLNACCSQLVERLLFLQKRVL